MTAHTAARERRTQAVRLLALADEFLQADWELFKALLIGAITLGDSVRDLIHVQDARATGIRQWEDVLEQRWPRLSFFRNERNYAMHRGLSRVHGLGYRSATIRLHVAAPGETPPPAATPQPDAGSRREAYFDDVVWSEKSASEYVADFLMDLEAVISDAEARF